MSVHETYFYKLPAILREIEACADTTFTTLVDEDIPNPMNHMANLIAQSHAGEGYEYGIHSDNAAVTYNDQNRVAVRLKDGHGIIVGAHDTIYANANHHIGELTPLDLVLFATDVKTSYNGYYMLIRYDLIACYANPYLTTPDAIWDFYDGILCECRSTVIDVRDMSIASLPYYKFRNLGETASYDIDHVREAIDANNGKLTITEKLDGSMIQMRYLYKEDLRHIADLQDRENSGEYDAAANEAYCRFADGLLYSTSGTLAGSSGDDGNDHLDSLVEYHLTGEERKKYLGVASAYPDLTFIYEFVHPQVDRHVVVYPEDKHGLYMLGARNVKTGKLSTHDEVVEMAERFNIPYPDIVASNIDEALALQRDGRGDEMEGMVADIDGWLIKIKLEGFLELSHIYHEIEGPAGFKAIADMALAGTLDDAMPSLPDGMRDFVSGVVKRFEVFEESQRAVIETMVKEELEQDGGDRKAFALWVNDLDCPSYWKGWLFQTAFKGGVECFWADRKGEEWRYLPQKEFEMRETELAEWLAKRDQEDHA